MIASHVALVQPSSPCRQDLYVAWAALGPRSPPKGILHSCPCFHLLCHRSNRSCAWRVPRNAASTTLVFLPSATTHSDLHSQGVFSLSRGDVGVVSLSSSSSSMACSRFLSFFGESVVLVRECGRVRSRRAWASGAGGHSKTHVCRRGMAAAMAESTAATKEYEMEEVQKHNTEDDCWLVIGGKVYDVTTYLPEHPGGADIMLGSTGASTWSCETAHKGNERAWKRKRKCVR